MVNHPPADAEALRTAVIAQIDTLSPRFRQVAQHLLDEPNDLAFEALSRVARRCGVQASTIVRFAQHFGFEGAAPMQRLLRRALLADGSSVGYAERLRQFNHSLAGTAIRGPDQLMDEFVEGNIRALQNLRPALDAGALPRAAAMIDAADTVFVVGTRRAFPVAAYLAYLLAKAGKRLVLVDNVAGLGGLQTTGMRPGDLLAAISFHPYAAETLALVDQAIAAGIGVLAITDSAISPIGREATQVLQVRETEVRGFRSVAASMALVQTLAIHHGLGQAEDAG